MFLNAVSSLGSSTSAFLNSLFKYMSISSSGSKRPKYSLISCFNSSGTFEVRFFWNKEYWSKDSKFYLKMLLTKRPIFLYPSGKIITPKPF
jgi:hypothetical protein